LLILGIETSTPHSSVCLATPEGTLATASLGLAQRHGEFVTPAIDFCLRQSGKKVDDITGVVVGIGPGLYTGLRVGLVSAKAFATARHLPVVGLSGLDVLAFQVRHVRRLVCAAMDARRGEVFWAFYRPAPGGIQRVSELSIGAPETLAAEIESSRDECLVVGDGGLRYRKLFEDADAAVAGGGTAWPQASQLAELAIPRFVREETQTPYEIAPIYLRVADAKIGWEQRGRMRGGDSRTGR
jgi:tRNA threonylcarbamoyladenosine biosynthesis protein TsaB